MYRRPGSKEPSPAPPYVSLKSEPNDQEPSKKYDLLWRKRSRKVHKTWEGDATGLVVRNGTDFSMVISANGINLGTAKLGPDLSILEAGNIVNAGSIEVEVGERQCSPTNPPKKAKLASSSFQLPTKLPLNLGTMLPRPPSAPPSAPLGRPPSAPSPLSRPPSRPPSAPTNVEPQRESTIRDKLPLNSSMFRPAANPVSTLPFAVPFRTPTLNSVPKPAVSIPKNPLPNLGVPLTPTASFVNPQKQVAGPATDLLPQLRPHQIDAVNFMKQCVLGERHRYGTGGILADEMGLGKTLSSIALISNLLSEKRILNALIVCPVSLVANWRQEFAKWLPPTANIGIMVIDKHGLGNGSLKNPALTFFNDTKFRAHQILVVGYERVRSFSAQLAEAGHQFDLVICDEGHRLKSAGTQTAEAVASVAGDKRIILSGTPIQNDLSEFWALANFVNPGCLHSEAKFNRQFAQPIDLLLSQESTDLKAKSAQGLATPEQLERAELALSELTEICNEVMLRRTSEVIQEYVSVPRHEYVVFVRPTDQQIKQYQLVSGQAQDLLTMGSAVTRKFDQQACLQTINELRKIAAGGVNEMGGKFRLLDHLLDVLSTNTDEKIVIVSGSTRVLDVCQSMLVSKQLQWLRLDGQTPQEKRQSSVRIFNRTDRNSAFAFLLSSRSGGMGLNLIGGSRLVLLDGDWNPAIDLQAMARIHRDGQTRPCYIYRFVLVGTIEEKIFQRQLSKIKLSKNVLLDAMSASAVAKTDFSKDVLRDLFTLSIPQKCNTLDVLGEHGRVKGYTEIEPMDEVLKDAMDRAKSVSCIMMNTE